MSAEDKGKEGGEGKTCRCPNLSGRVAFVLLTEAHVTVPMTLGGYFFRAFYNSSAQHKYPSVETFVYLKITFGYEIFVQVF